MPNVAQFLIERLKSNGVNHMLNVPGDYSLAFNKYVEKSNIELVGTTNEANAGFAADGYARVNNGGMSAVCVTYCVGGFSLINAIGGAFAEKSPVVVISGSPGMKERNGDVLLHHMVRSFECQHEIFENITCANTVLRDPSRAAFEIDRVLEAAKHYKQPVYIELPRDMVEKPITYDAYTVGTPSNISSDQENLQEILSDTINWITNAKNPVIWAGVEVARFGLGQKLMKFAEQTGIPIATDILGKSCIGERHPMSLGVYSESTSRPEVVDFFAKSDCVIMLGVMMTDMNLGFLPLRHKRRNTINATSQTMQVRNHTYANVQFGDFVDGLCKHKFQRRESVKMPGPAYTEKWEAKCGVTLKADRLMEKVNAILTEDMTVIADVGDSLFGALDVTVHGHNQFLASAFYTSMGFAVPAALGAQLANPKMRPIVLVGDGAFQMTGQEFSTLVRRKMNPIVIVLNNGGYGTERILLEGSFNDIQNWNFENMPLLVGGGKGAKATTEDELDAALSQALVCKEPFIINTVIERGDFTPALSRMFSKLAKKV
jgi:indolepyruvate decarboxylase